MRTTTIALLALIAACGARDDVTEPDTETTAEDLHAACATPGVGGEEYGVDIFASPPGTWYEPRCNVLRSGAGCVYPAQPRAGFEVEMTPGSGWGASNSSTRNEFQVVWSATQNSLSAWTGWTDGPSGFRPFSFSKNGFGSGANAVNAYDVVSMHNVNFGIPGPVGTDTTAPLSDFLHMWCTSSHLLTESYVATTYRCDHWEADVDFARLTRWFSAAPVYPFPQAAEEHILTAIYARAAGLGQQDQNTGTFISANELSKSSTHYAQWASKASGSELDWVNNFDPDLEMPQLPGMLQNTLYCTSE